MLWTFLFLRFIFMQKIKEKLCMKWLSLLSLIVLISSCASDVENVPETGRIKLLEQSNPLSVDKQNIAIDIPQAVINTDWEQAGGLPFKDIGNLKGSIALLLKWKQDIGSISGTKESTIQPIISAGKIYTLDGEGLLSALSADTGDILWQEDLSEKADHANFRGGGIAAQAGYIFMTTGNGFIYAIDGEDGNIIWEVNNHIPFSAPPTITGGSIYVIDRENRLQALDMKTGRALWDYRGLPYLSAYSHYASAAVVGSVIMAPFSSGEIVGLDGKTSKPVWSYSMQSRDVYNAHLSKVIAAHPVISGRHVYVTTPSSYLIALDAITGKTIWKKNISADRTPLSVGDFLYVIDTKNRFMALAKETGNIAYITQLPQYEDAESKEDPIFWTSPLMVDGHIITFSNQEKMAHIDPKNGNIVTFKDSPEVAIDPVIANEILYVLDKDGDLYAFE